ncbi:MAG: hypothetical protein MI739_01825 [Bacteroidales bacterium]|nr:hypothetical protein [Bacteroidales bacterium]
MSNKILSLIKRLTLFVLFLFLFLNPVKSQFYSTGQDPASAKWEQINTPNFQIIFQKDFSQKAQQIANILEFYYTRVGESLKHKPRKISVIVHNQTIRSNGYVVWAPKRMELYATPSPSANQGDWLEHLCVHELRHVVQLDNLNQGITKILSVVFGQQYIGLVAGQLPMWFLEGDAVCTETALTNFGRGRNPAFNSGLKNILLSEQESYSYDRMLFGSYREFTPNHYVLGYHMTSFVRMKYGKYVWDDVHSYVAKNSYTFLPTSFAFYYGLKKRIKKSQQELYSETINYLDSIWTNEQKKNKPHKPKLFQEYQINQYEDYLNPLFINDDNIITLKRGYSHIPQFVLVHKDYEEVLHEPGILLDNHFSYSNDVIAWSEYKPDVRWRNREFNSIKLMNIKTKKVYTLIDKCRFFSPSISPSQEKIAVVDVDNQSQSSLVLLDCFNGNEVERIEPNGSHLQYPDWSSDGNSIYVVEMKENKKWVSKYDIANKKWSYVFDVGNSDIQKIKSYDDKVYFHSTINGIDNVYVFDEKSKAIFQLTNSRFGIANFDVNRNDVIVVDRDSLGFRLEKIPIERALWRRVNFESSYNYKLAEIITEQEKSLAGLDTSGFRNYNVTPYRKLLNVFNFHSWVPFYFDSKNIDLGDVSELFANSSGIINPGLMLFSQNKLSTTETILSYAYKENNHFLSSSIELKGKYPILRLSAEYGNSQMILAPNNLFWTPKPVSALNYIADLYVPFNFSSGKFVRGFVPLVSIDYQDNLFYDYSKKQYLQGLGFFQTRLLYYSYLRKAKQDIIPQLGAVLKFNLFNTPFDSDLYGYLYNFNSVFYLPGGKNKSFSFDLGYQYQKPKLYLYQSNFNFPRGVYKRRTEKMFKCYTDYVFPIAYPEWNLGSLIYIKRLRGRGFVDYALNSYRTRNGWLNENIYSFGIELRGDYHLFRMLFPLTTGLRLGYRSIGSSPFVDILFNIDLKGM